MFKSYRTRRPLLLAVSLLFSVAGPRVSIAQDPPILLGEDPRVRELRIQLLRGSADSRLGLGPQSLEFGMPARGTLVQPAFPDEDAGRLLESGRPPISVLVAPTNVRINDKTGDAANSGQAEQSIAMLGNFGLCAWNDGQGFVVGPHTQGVAYTTDGGATWVDVGNPPTAGATGGTITAWTSDPVVAVNTATGEFYYCGMVNLSPSNNGIAVVPATFPAGVFTWGTPHVVRNVSNATNFLDKEWLAVDPGTGNLYVTYTNFFVGGNSIDFQRSTTNGLTWGPVIALSSPAANGLVQGSRPAVGPGGEVYCTWYEIGPVDLDFLRVRKSTDNGVSFGAQVAGASIYTNWGTGAPGFNRNRGLAFPAIAVDQSGGPHHGRVYLSWNESINFYDDPIGGGTSKSEVESNNTPAAATPFTVNQVLRGSIESSTALDYWSFPAVQGTDYIFFTDSLSGMLYTMRIFCSDGNQRLAFAGDVSAPGGGAALIVWTAPTTATYYLRMAGAGSGTGGYRILTGANQGGPERSRDHRDAFVAWSDDGIAWSTPVRVNDDPGYYDNWLPEVVVPCDGFAYTMWYDWRDDLASCGGKSHVYSTRSYDGGATWVANQRITTAMTNWTTTATNIIPNQGDYHGMYGGDVVAYSWADGRLGDVDVFGAFLRLGLTIACPADTAVDPNTFVSRPFTVSNANVTFDTPAAYTVTSARNWPGFPIAGKLNVPAGGSVGAVASFTVPDTASPGQNTLTFIVVEQGGVKADTCTAIIDVRRGQPHVKTMVWKSLPMLVDPRTGSGVEGGAASLICDRIYVSHGFRFGDSNLLSIYDVRSGSWIHGGLSAPDAAVFRSEMGGGTVGGFHYAVGGRTLPNADVEEFDPATFTWTPKTSMSIPRGGLGVASSPNRLYAIGGRDGATFGSGTILGLNEEFDPAGAGTWTPKAPLPVPVSDNYATLAYRGKVYVFGGATSPTTVIGTVQIYDITTDTWSFGAPMPTPRAAAMAGVIKDKIAVFGGYDGAGNVAVTELYDPVADTWSLGPPMPTPVSEMAQGVTYDASGIYSIGTGIFGVSGSVLYVLTTAPDPIAWQTLASLVDPRTGGGVEGASASLICDRIYVSHGYRFGDSNLFSVYDISTDTWTHGGVAAPDALVARSEMGGGTALGRHYAVGGRTGPNADVEEFDPVTGTWTLMTPMPLARGGLGVASSGEKLYAIGGRGGPTFGAAPIYGDNEEFDPTAGAGGTWTARAPLPIPVSDNYATIAYLGKIYVFGGVDATGTVIPTTQIYDIATDTWAFGAPMPTTRAAAMAGVIECRIAVFGGTDGVSNQTATELYDPATNTWSAGPPLPAPLSEISQGVTYDDFGIYSIGTGIFGVSGSDVYVLAPVRKPTVDVPERPLAGVSLAPSPNPSRGEVSFSFSLPAAGEVRLDILDVTGRRVWSAIQPELPAGSYTLHWSGRSASGSPVSPGIYYASLATPLGTRTAKLVRLQ